ncbi:MAG: 50S ribosomal protein L31 [Candidatus Blackburnbacteria bacterium]|nr:50S ribosomal protein L31 [Candidatus Blackburnbacteria bacterium]
MKTSIHPTWYPESRVRCACGNEFTVGSTLPEIHVEVCSACHPFFTGQVRYVDTAGRVEKFTERQKIAAMRPTSKKERRSLKRKQRLEEELSRPASLEEVRGAR